MTTAYLGGAFNPPHIGHLVIAERVREARGFDRIDLLVSGQPPHADPKFTIDTKHRLAMAKLAVAGNAGLGADDRETKRAGKSYTIDTARELIAQGIKRPAFIIGGDMLADLPTWREVGELLKIADCILGKLHGPIRHTHSLRADRRVARRLRNASPLRNGPDIRSSKSARRAARSAWVSASRCRIRSSPCCTTALTEGKRPSSTSDRAKACWSSRSEIELLIVIASSDP